MDVRSSLLFAAFALVQLQTSFCFWSNTCPNQWNKLTVNFPRFYDMPMTEQDAIEDGKWQRSGTLACDGNAYFVGKRYTNGQDTLLYDKQGVIAGIQGTLDPNVVVPQKYKDMVTLDNGKRYVTAYFTEPATICKEKPKRKDDCVGEKLIIQTGKTPKSLSRIPLQEQGLSGSKWVKGKCFVGMGQHYWYDISNNMDCDNFFPVFLLYNGGKLNAFGWAFGGDAKNGHFEHPPSYALGAFFDAKTQPKCLKSFTIRSTQHIYFQSSSLKYFC